MKKISNLKIYSVLVAISVLLGVILGYKVAFGFFGIFHLLMWVNVSITDICNAITVKETRSDTTLYKIMCILISSICLPIFLF